MHGGLILADTIFANIGPPWRTDFSKRGPFLAAKIGTAEPILAASGIGGPDQF